MVVPVMATALKRSPATVSVPFSSPSWVATEGVARGEVAVAATLQLARSGSEIAATTPSAESRAIGALCIRRFALLVFPATVGTPTLSPIEHIVAY
jgi:hypothetical protein